MFLAFLSISSSIPWKHCLNEPNLALALQGYSSPYYSGFWLRSEFLDRFFRERNLKIKHFSIFLKFQPLFLKATSINEPFSADECQRDTSLIEKWNLDAMRNFVRWLFTRETSKSSIFHSCFFFSWQVAMYKLRWKRTSYNSRIRNKDHCNT